MAQVYMRHFEQGVAIAKENLTAPNSNLPLVLSGGLTPYNYGAWWSGAPGVTVIPGTPYPLGFVY
jgi:hypothetical protein